MQMDIKTISARKQHSELLQKNTFETPEKRRNNRFFEQLRRLSGVPGLTGAALSLIFAFFAGRIELGGILRPFGAAFVLACFLHARSAYAGGMKMNPYLAMAGVFAALSTRTSTMENIGFAFSVIGTLGALTAGMAITKIPLRRYTVMLAAGASYLVMTFAFLLNSPGSALYMLAECLIVCAFVIVFDNSLKILTVRRKLILTDEETLSCIASLLCLVIGFGGMGLFGKSLRNILSVLLCLIASTFGGAAIGGSAGILCGLTAVLSGDSSMILVCISAASLLSGCIKKAGRYIIAAVFLLTDLFFRFTMKEALPPIDVLIGAGIFILLPKKALHYFGSFINANLLRENEQALHKKRFNELTMGRLKEIAQVFASAGKIFCEEKKERKISYMLSLVPEKACSGCLFFDSCWDRGFEDSYALMQLLYEKFEHCGVIDEEDLGEEMEAKCIRTQRLLGVCREVFGKYIENTKVEERIMKSRHAVGEQMHGIAKVIRSLAGDVDINFRFHEELEDAVKEEMDKIGIKASEICVEYNCGTIRASLKLRTDTTKTVREGIIREAVSRGCGVEMSYIEGESTKNGSVLTYEQMKEYRLACGVASITKSGSEASGDTYSFEKLRDGRQMLLLCDGMGSGRKAARESIQAVSLVEDFYRAGFDDETVLNTINRLLILSSSDEIFSTMDMCMVKLTTGLARFTKIGAPHSYLIRSGYAKKLSAGSLPMGILDEFEPACHDVQLMHGDIIIMFSDGIADLETKDADMFEIITDAIELRDPQAIAKEIAHGALSLSSGIAKDDITVIVAKVQKLRQEKITAKKAA